MNINIKKITINIITKNLRRPIFLTIKGDVLEALLMGCPHLTQIIRPASARSARKLVPPQF